DPQEWLGTAERAERRRLFPGPASLSRQVFGVRLKQGLGEKRIFSRDLAALQLVLPDALQHHQTVVLRVLIQGDSGLGKRRRTGTLDERNQFRKERKKDRDIVFGNGGQLFVNAFLKAGKLLVKLEKFSNGRIFSCKLARASNTTVPG